MLSDLRIRYLSSHTCSQGAVFRNYPATLFSESGSDMFFQLSFISRLYQRFKYGGCQTYQRPSGRNSKAEMTDAVMTLLDADLEDCTRPTHPEAQGSLNGAGLSEQQCTIQGKRSALREQFSLNVSRCVGCVPSPIGSRRTL